MRYAAALSIPTCNRCDVLRQCIRGALRQTVLLEVIVLDDGSSDGTQAMMQSEFPQVRYERFQRGSGPCVLRNRGIQIASAPIVFSPDDDTSFVSEKTAEQTLRDFDDPRVAAVAIPFINTLRGPQIHHTPPDGDDIYIAYAFVGAAHAVRRDAFLRVGGYREHLYYMGEEGDLCLRLLASGLVTRLGTADPIHHLESPHRVSARADFYGRRNDLLFAWQNAPAAYLAPHLAGTIVNGVRYSMTDAQHPKEMLRGIWTGFGDILDGAAAREPVSKQVYRLFRRLKKKGPLPLHAVLPLLPPLS